MSIFIGIDTSNYTTSAAIVEDGHVTDSFKLPVFVRDGERGSRQSDAVFSHVKNLPEIMKQVGKRDLTAVGVSIRPRDVEGSYMPCFLAGVSVATAVSEINGIPLYTFSHQAGHIQAALYSSGMLSLVKERFLAFHVSGGTTEVLYCSDGSIKKIGGTLDLNAGQVIDRAGVLLGMKFPCGAELERICDFNTRIKPTVCVKGIECNLSGIENKVIGMLQSGTERSLIAAFVILSVEKTLEGLVESAFAEYGKLPLVFSGGVTSNSFINRELTAKYGAHFAEPAFSSDNAAGTALLCEAKYKESIG